MPDVSNVLFLLELVREAGWRIEPTVAVKAAVGQLRDEDLV